MVATVISSLVSLLFVGIVYFVLYRKYALDKYREELFRLRNELFDLALTGGLVRFKSHTYVNLELLINNNIRYAHHISFVGLIIFGALNQLKYPGVRVTSRVANDFANQLSTLRPSPGRETLSQIKARFDTQTIKYLLRTSPFFVAYVVTLTGFFVSRRLFQTSHIRSLLKKYLVSGVNQEIEAQAEQYCTA